MTSDDQVHAIGRSMTEAVHMFQVACTKMVSDLLAAFASVAPSELLTPRRTRSGRWRARLITSRNGDSRIAVYRTRELAMRAIVRSIEVLR